MTLNAANLVTLNKTALNKMIEEYCMNHDTQKTEFFREMLPLLYGYGEAEDWQMLHLSVLISRERNPKLKETLQDFDDYLCF